VCVFLTRTYLYLLDMNEFQHVIIIIIVESGPLYYYIIYIYDPIIRFYNISFKIKLNKLLIWNNSKRQVYILTSCVIFFNQNERQGLQWYYVYINKYIIVLYYGMLSTDFVVILLYSSVRVCVYVRGAYELDPSFFFFFFFNKQ